MTETKKEYGIKYHQRGEMKSTKEYVVKIYSGITEDNNLEFETTIKGYPKTIFWVKSPGFATIEKVK